MSWPLETIDNLCVKVASGGTPLRSQESYWNNGTIPWLKTGELNDAYIFSSEEKVTHEAIKNSSAKVFPENTILMAMYGDGKTITTLGILGVPMSTNQACAAMQANSEICDYRYLFYALKRERHKLLKLVVAGAQRNLSLSIVKRFELPYPPLSTQERIASTLSAYDDLIENNRRRIALLEESARLLYREWFVHLRFPGHETTKIIDGVPEGWEIKKVNDVLEKMKSKPKIRKDEYLDEGAYPCIDQGQSFVGGYTDNEEAVYKDGLPLIVFGDHTRALKFLNIPFARGADGTQLCKSNNERLSQEMFYWALVSVDLSNYFYARHFKFLKDQKIFLPNVGLGKKFTDFSRANFAQIEKLRQQNFELTTARDTLLPRLMDGRVSV